MLLSSSQIALLWLCNVAAAINISVASTGGNISSPLQYGIMFEEINHSGDGGIYAELVRNRAFQGSSAYPSTVFPWEAVGGAKLSLENLTAPLSAALPTSLNVAVDETTNKTAGILNPGWWGIDVKPQVYKGSFWVRGEYSGDFTASLQSALIDQVFASVKIPATKSSADSGWVNYNYTLKPTVAAPNSNNSLVISFESAGVADSSLSFNLISLFPPTYNDRANGMRVDLMQNLKDLNPSFIRLSGNSFEGNYSMSPYYWRWNATIGPLIDRPAYTGTWKYMNTMGLGLTELLSWCEDLGAEPILGLWAGYFLDHTVIAEKDLGPYVQDVLDELEFIMGDETTEFGALRISLGYPVEGWKINYVEVGNEDYVSTVGQETYTAYRFAAFYDAIAARYPNITILSSSEATKYGASAEDYHLYNKPDQLVSKFRYFDNDTHADPKHLTLIGEFSAAQGNSETERGANSHKPRWPFPTWIGSVAEAVFVLGAERNTKKMIGASYAPLFQNLNSYQWTPNLISFTADPAQTVLSTSWHVLKLLSNSRFSKVLPTDSNSGSSSAFWVAGVKCNGAHLLKAAVYNSTEAVPFSVTFRGSSALTAELVVLTAPSPLYSTSIGEDSVHSNRSTITAVAGVFSFILPEWSVAVLTTR